MTPATFLPPPQGIRSIVAWPDGTTGEWYVDIYPLICTKTNGHEYDALNVNGDWLRTLDSALLLEDGRVVCPGETTFDSTSLWLAEVKKQERP